MQRQAGHTEEPLALGAGSVADGWPGSADPAAASDAALLERCRRGDAAAWDALVGRYQGLVFGVVRRAGGSRDDAADVTQATFVTLLDAIDDLRADERLAGWLITVARRVAWQSRRQEERGRVVVPAQETTDPIEDWEQVAWMHECLQRLAAPCRELLSALYLDPTTPTYSEVAARTRRAIGTIGPMRARCLERLRAIMTDGVDP